MGRPHTGHDAVFTGTRQARPTKIVTFPRYKAEKSPFQQHDLSILIVGPNQLKYRLSGTRKPKSHPSSNTQCPITPIPRGARYVLYHRRHGCPGPHRSAQRARRREAFAQGRPPLSYSRLRRSSTQVRRPAWAADFLHAVSTALETATRNVPNPRRRMFA